MGDVLPDRFDDGDLVLRRWVPADAAALHEAIERNVEHLRPWMPWIAFEPLSLEQRVELIEGWERDRQAGGDVVLGLFLDGAIVGSTGLHRRLGPEGLEIGYWVDRDHLGRGVATRAARLLTGAALALPGITHVGISCDDGNHASARVPEKLGFTLTAVVASPMLAAAHTGRHRVYRMARADWRTH